MRGWAAVGAASAGVAVGVALTRGGQLIWTLALTTVVLAFLGHRSRTQDTPKTAKGTPMENNWFAHGEDGLMRSTDGGRTWHPTVVRNGVHYVPDDEVLSTARRLAHRWAGVLRRLGQ